MRYKQVVSRTVSSIEESLCLPGVSILAQTNGQWSASVEVCSEPNRP
jgi:hypothetical protein